MSTRTGRIVFEADIAEMQADVTTANDLVPIDEAKIRAVAEGDQDPLFVTMNIATEGVSKNGRLYTKETIQAMADQINEEAIDGHNGHIPDKDRATKRPDPVVLWLGAKVIQKNGKAYLYAKGYIMPEEPKLRSYLRKAKALGKNVAVSVFGKAEKAVYDQMQKAYNLVNFKLQSVDFARSKSEGIPNDGTLILASEMVNEGEENRAMKRQEVIESLTKEELRTHNPALVSEMEQEAVDATGVNIAEMQEITETLGDDPATAIAEMQRENRELKLDQQLAEKVKVRGARPVLREMVIAEMANADGAVDVAEMVDTFLGGDEAKAIIATHREKAPAVNPLDASRGESIPQRKHSNIIKRSKRS